jgi:hypothetical protein
MNAIGNKEITSLPVDNYLAFRWRLSAISSVTSLESNEVPFYLKHYDDKGGYILVDDDFNITGIIDREFASAEAKDLAFSSPCMMWSIEDNYDGLNNVSKNENLPVFSKPVGVRISPILSWMVGNGSGSCSSLVVGWKNDESAFEARFQGLRKPFAIDGESSISSYRNWKAEAID